MSSSPYGSDNPSSAVHVPVLLREVLAELDLRPGLVVVDGTVGAGGHSREVWSRIQPGGRLIGLDRDPLMLDLARRNLHATDCELVHAPYSQLRTVLDDRGIATVDRVLLDLGLSSDQLADRARGFGFDAGGPLDMRFDPTQGQPVSDWLNRAGEAELTSALTDFGEVAGAERLAAAIVRERRQQPLATTHDLLRIIDAALVRGARGGHGKSPAPQVFQALRIVANQELEHLRTFLDDTLPACLAPGGRVGIISFHSTEDRFVKPALTPAHGWTPLHRKPIEATPAEARINPRSRSARLRIASRSMDTPV